MGWLFWLLDGLGGMMQLFGLAGSFRSSGYKIWCRVLGLTLEP